MKIQAMTLAFSCLAMLSTTAANAQYTTVVDAPGLFAGDNVLSYPAVMAGGCGPILDTSCGSPLSCYPMFGKHTYADDGIDRHRAGLLGGLLGGGLLGGGLLGGGGYGVSSFSAVVPNACSPCRTAIAPICGQRVANSVFDIRLFRFGLGFGRVSPRWDMRPMGEAI